MQATSKKLSKDYPKPGSKAKNIGASTSELMELFEEQLKHILWSEKVLIRAIPKIITLASSDDLILVLTDHLHQTHKQITRLARIFRTIEKKPAIIKCDAMEGMIIEASELMEECGKGPKCDTGIIAAAKKIKHFKIATYATLREYAETLELHEAESILKKTHKDEEEAEQNLTEVALHKVNMEAASAKMQEQSNQMGNQA